MRKRQAVGSVLIANVAGVPAYFASFLFAYGFEEGTPGVGSHITFLTLIAVFAVVAGGLSLAFPLSRPPYPPRERRLLFGISASISLNAAVVAVGSIISAAHKDDGSVSQGFSSRTVVLIAAGLLAISLIFCSVAFLTDLEAGEL